MFDLSHEQNGRYDLHDQHAIDVASRTASERAFEARLALIDPTVNGHLNGTTAGGAIGPCDEGAMWKGNMTLRLSNKYA